MPKHISIPRSLFILLVAAPLLLGAWTVASRPSSVALPAMFRAGIRIRDDKQREFDIIRVEGDWAEIKLRTNGTLTSGIGDVWLHIPTNNMYTQQ